METVRRALTQLDGAFTDKEAWFLFRWSAWLETVGWTGLLIGIAFQVKHWPGDGWVLPIGGSLHGTFVIIYMLITFFTFRSLGWSWRRFIFAELINIVPFGVLVLELYIAKERSK